MSIVTRFILSIYVLSFAGASFICHSFARCPGANVAVNVSDEGVAANLAVKTKAAKIVRFFMLSSYGCCCSCSCSCSCCWCCFCFRFLPVPWGVSLPCSCCSCCMVATVTYFYFCCCKSTPSAFCSYSRDGLVPSLADTNRKSKARTIKR